MCHTGQKLMMRRKKGEFVFLISVTYNTISLDFVGKAKTTSTKYYRSYNYTLKLLFVYLNIKLL